MPVQPQEYSHCPRLKVFWIGVFLRFCDLCMFEERVIETLLVNRMLRNDFCFWLILSKCFYFVSLVVNPLLYVV